MASRIVRAKFRCMSITNRYDGIVTAELKAVMNRKGGNYEENKMFWEYSPNGEAHLTFKTDCTMAVGAYYYIDMCLLEGETKEDGTWLLQNVSRYDSGGGSIDMCMRRNYDHRNIPRGLIYGTLKISLDAKAKGAIDMLKDPGTSWSVNFSFAEPSDGE